MERNILYPSMHWKELAQCSPICHGCARAPQAQPRGVRHTCWRTPAAPCGWRCGRASPVGSAGWSGRWWGAAAGSGRWTFCPSFRRRPKERGETLSLSHQGREKEDQFLSGAGPNLTMESLRKWLKSTENLQTPHKLWPWVIAGAYTLWTSLSLWTPRTALSSMVASSYMWLFKLKWLQIR